MKSGEIWKRSAKARARAGVVWVLLAPLILVGITNPQTAFAAPSLSLPATLTAGTSFTNVNSAGTLSISGYNAGASIQVTVSTTTGNLKIVTTTGLTAPTGYSSSAWTSSTSTEIAFYGSEADVSNALNSLQFKAAAVDAPATITVTSFVAGAAYNSTTGHFYEIVDNTSVISWELARCKALYSNSDVSVSAGASLMNTNRCTSSTTLTRRTLGGLQGYLATITTRAEHDFIYGKLPSTGWIGGADTDSEGTFIWMDGPEKGRVFWTSASTQRGESTTVSGSVAGFSYGSNRFNFFGSGEPNDAGGAEDFAEFGFGASGSWNDCQNGCNRTKYVIEYGEDSDVLSGASGTINVNPRTPISNETDTAMSFNGTNHYADVADSTGSAFDITGTLTLEAWVYPSNSCPTAGAVISKRSYMLYCQEGVWKVMILANGVSGSGVTTNIPVRPNQWQHIAMTKSSSSGNALFYLNGDLAATVATGVTSMTPNNDAFEIGRYSQISTFYFQGQIDEVKLWDSVRDAGQIQTGMHSRPTLSDSNLKAYYDFNQGQGSKVFNLSTSSGLWSNDLVISNSAPYVGDSITATSTSGPYTVQRFLRSYITANNGWKAPSGVSKVLALVVAGGGGAGGGLNAGGGGAGGFIETLTTVSQSAPYPITVGTGGIGWRSNQRTLPKNGTNSSAFSLTAIGGGFGGVEDYYSAGIHYAPSSGGSGGGGSWGQTASYRVGAAGTTGQGNKGGNNVDYCCTGAGGGGAGGVGVNTSSTKAGDGGPGKTSSVTGTILAGGGGGSSRNVGVNLIGSGGSGGGGSAGSTNGGDGTSGSANTGGGGGAAWANPETSGSSGSGGSGLVAIKWITASAPSYTGPVSDTLTAGMVETFTVTGTPISPLTRSYRWQVSSETGSAASWVNATTGTGLTSASYVTPILETSTSGTRYRYRVVVTDSDSDGLSIVETSTAIVFLTINPRITITGSSVSLSQKYGETQTVIYTIANGTGTRTTAASPNNRTGITWSSVSGSSATLGIGTGLGFGTYYETLTVTDSVTATTTQMITISISKADTITVTNSVVTMTYSGAQATSGYTITGLKNSETATASVNYEGISPTVLASTSTAPTNAGNYRAKPSTIVLSAGASVNNYQNVNYESATVTINKANQARLTIGQYDAFPGISTYPLNVYGGTGLGAVTRSLDTTGSANCTLRDLMFITALNPGICSVRAVKSGGINYFDETTTATIYWIQFTNRYTNSGPTSPTDLGLSGGTAVEKRTYETFTVLSFADETGTAVTSIKANTKLRVIGTGFVASDAGTVVYFGLASVPHSGLTFNTLDPMANYVLLTVPEDAETDRVLMYSTGKRWSTPSPGVLTILP